MDTNTHALTQDDATLTDTGVLKIARVLEQGRLRVKAHFERLLPSPAATTDLLPNGQRRGERA